jgi:UDP-2,3-diacylglucosamine pyrophosphatase LpxH
MRHTVVLSDIHLCETEPGTGLWMRYRQAAFAPDAELARMLRELRERVRGAELSLVLNGDVFDFDAPRVIDNRSVFHDLPRRAEHAVPAMKAILRDHTVFVRALAEVLADGHGVVFVSGNHDVQMTLPEVRAVIHDRLVEETAAVLREAGREGPPREDLDARILFRAWFHKTADGIVVEHGNQYDAYCSYRYPMAPFGREEREIQPTVGSLTARNLASRMGFFNPHVDSSYMLSAFGYFAHWARHYLFSRRSLAAVWAVGAVRTVIEILRRREPARRDRRRANIATCARETGVSLKTAARHMRLFAAPMEDTLSAMLHGLWLDRVAIGAVSVLAGLVWLLVAHGPLVAGAALCPAAVIAYQLMAPTGSLEKVWDHVRRVARRVGKIHGARAVVFGHTHRPEGAWEDGVFYGNTGSWSAAFRDLACTQPVFEYRPLVWLRGEGDKLSGGLIAWKDGRFEAHPG